MNKARSILILIILFGYNSIQSKDISFKSDSEKIVQLKQATDSLIKYIEDLKGVIKNYSSDKHTTLDILLIEEGRAELLKLQIKTYKKLILSNFSEYITEKELNQLLPTEVRSNQFSSWEDEFFGHISQEASLAILSVFQIWVINSKDTIIERFK
jgi:hypothetical protein